MARYVRTETASEELGRLSPSESFPADFMAQPTTTAYYVDSSHTLYTSSPAFVSTDRKGEYLLLREAGGVGSTTADSVQQLAPMQLPLDGDAGSVEVVEEEPLGEFMDAYFVDHQQEASTSSRLDDDMGDLVEEEVYEESLEEELFDDSVEDVQRDEREQRKKRQAESARARYQRLSEEERREVNSRRMAAQKRKKQRDREVEQLEEILRETNDIQEDTALTEAMKEKKIRARRAEAARSRYQRMSEDERRAYNQRRRMRQLGLDGKRDVSDSFREHIKLQNAKKAESARLRYHRMTPEEKREYNQRRTLAFRRRRQEEEILLSTPAGRISADALNRAQQIMIRNARRAEAARLRYQKMNPEERKLYNQKRSAAKRSREQAAGSSAMSTSSMDSGGEGLVSVVNEEALSSLEKDVIRRTQRAQMVLSRRGQVLSSLDGDEGGHVLVVPQPPPPPLHLHHNLEEKAQVYQVQQPTHIISHEKLDPSMQTIYMQDEDGNHVQVQVVSVSTAPGGQTTYTIAGPPPAPPPPMPRPRTRIYHSRRLDTAESLPENVVEEVGDEDPRGDLHLQSHFVTGEGDILAAATAVVDMNAGEPSTAAASEHSAPSRSLTPAEMTLQQKIERQKAKRAARARHRYHNMSDAARREFNSRRASALRKARQRDEELCQLADSAHLNGDNLDDETRAAVAEAQRRRARRAEAARAKYHRMNSEERRQYNAMRDAQRRQRKREQEQNGALPTPPRRRSTHAKAAVAPLPPPAVDEAELASSQPLIYSTYEMYQQPLDRWEH